LEIPASLFPEIRGMKKIGKKVPLDGFIAFDAERTYVAGKRGETRACVKTGENKLESGWRLIIRRRLKRKVGNRKVSATQSQNHTADRTKRDLPDYTLQCSRQRKKTRKREKRHPVRCPQAK